MISEWQSVLTLFIGPGLTAAFVSYFFSVRSEQFKQKRIDALTAIENARESVKQACSAGTKYFSSENKKDTGNLQSEVMLHESLMRSDISILKSQVSYLDISWDSLDKSVEDLIVSLTGGDFGSSTFSRDINRCIYISGNGSNLLVEINSIKKIEFDHSQNFRLHHFKSKDVVLSFIFISYIFMLSIFLVSYVFGLHSQKYSDLRLLCKNDRNSIQIGSQLYCKVP